MAALKSSLVKLLRVLRKNSQKERVSPESFSQSVTVEAINSDNDQADKRCRRPTYLSSLIEYLKARQQIEALRQSWGDQWDVLQLPNGEVFRMKDLSKYVTERNISH